MTIRLACALLAFAGCFAASAASAMTQPQLDCPVHGLPASFPADYATTIQTDAPGKAHATAMMDRVVDAADACLQQQKIPKSLLHPYRTYAHFRVSREGYATLLARRGISTVAIDKALDFGPGRANPVINQRMNDDQIAALTNGLKAAGINVDTLSEDTSALIGGYVSATSHLFTALAQLG